jgi:hypothetical protein
VKLWTEDEQLRVRSAKGVLTPDLRDLLALHKAELVKLLQKKSNASDTFYTAGTCFAPEELASLFFSGRTVVLEPVGAK